MGTTSADATLLRLEAVLASIPHARLAVRDGMATIGLAADTLEPALRALRDSGGFESVTFVTGVDRMGTSPRFEVVHQLHSMAHGERVRLHTPVAEGASLPTCTHLWPGAAFMERECFDMFGIRFDGHVGLKRLLMPEDYTHHPLRKDFPHQGIEPDRLYREWDRKRREGWQPEAEAAR